MDDWRPMTEKPNGYGHIWFRTETGRCLYRHGTDIWPHDALGYQPTGWMPAEELK